MTITQTHIAPHAATALTELVGVRARFLRSVNLERDFGTDAPLSGYVPTPGARAALARICAGVAHPHERAWSVTGPYGTGKSAFALLLAKTLTLPPMGDPGLRALVGERLFDADTDGFFPILVTGGREPLARALARGLRPALALLPPEVVPPFSEDTVGGRDVARRYEAVSAALIAHQPGCRGLLVVVDELGKFLEHAALRPEAGDVQALQEMAEAAVRSQNAPVLLVTVLHQSFAEYAHRLPGTQQAEWRKVQGRFADLPFGDGADDGLRLIGGAISQKEDAEAERQITPVVARQLQTCKRLGLRPKALTEGEFAGIVRAAWPLHPAALLALPPVFRRFGQNERSLFSFLGSGEPHGFVDFLGAHALSSGAVPALRLAEVFDYVLGALGANVSGHAQAGRLWSATQEALLRCEMRPPLWADLVKTIGLLHLLGDGARLPASRDVLHFACDHYAPAEVDEALAGLQASTLITYRHYKKAFRPYEGSDIDVDARLRDARADLAPGLDTVQAAAHLSVAPPVVARRHSYETGTLRYFTVRACRGSDLAEAAARPAGVDGVVALCLVPDAAAQASAEAAGRALTAARPDVVLCVSRETEALREAALTVASLRRVQDETPELDTDPVARREVDERLREASAVLDGEWSGLLLPSAEAVWLWQGERQEGVSLQTLLSQACDAAYPHTPRLRNELINRRQLSTTAASARRELITAMLTRAPEPRLGIDGWPPEASMYVSVLEETGLHRDGSFCPPPDPHSALGQVWAAMEEFLFGGALEAKPLPLLHERLTSPPFGLTDGLVPVLLCAVLLHHADEVLVYEEGRFVTQLDAATFERMMKRPEDYAFQGCQISGARQMVVGRFAQGLPLDGAEPTLVNVVRSLFRIFARLPEYTLKTRTLAADARALRDVFREARNPERLLLVDIPALLGHPPFGTAPGADADMAAFFAAWNRAMSELMGAYDALLGRMEAHLRAAFGVGDWQELRERAGALGAHIAEPKLVAFAQRASDTTLGRRKWLESVGALVAGRPPAAWSDGEEARFAPKLAPLAAAFRHTELLAFEKARTAAASDVGARVGLRLSVTQDTGEEEASLVILPRQNNAQIEQQASALLGHFNDTMKGESYETRLAVIGQVMQQIMREKPNV